MAPWDGPSPDDPRPDAVLLDVDGALLDTPTVWAAVVGGLVRSFGGVWLPDDAAAVRGWPVPALCAELARRGVPLASDEVAERLGAGVMALLRRGLPWRPGARTLLVSLTHAGVPCALVTVGPRSVADAVRADLPDDSLGAVVSGDDPGPPLPAPDAYLLAARQLQVDPGRCAAVEEAPTGVRGALGAGAFTYAVDPRAALPAPVAAHPRLRRVDDLAAVGRALLASW